MMHRITKIAWILTLGTTSSIALGQQPAPAPAAPAAAPAAVTAPEPAAAPLAAPAQAVAPEAAKESGEEPFGKAGVINIGSDISLDVHHTGYSAPSGGVAPSSTTSYAIGPAADYFVIDNLSLGAMVLFQRIPFPGIEAKEDIISFEPRIGYHIPLVPEKLGLWPRLSYFYEHGKLMVSGAPDTTLKSMGISAFVPLLIHPVEHFHFGFGPYFQTDLSAKLDGQDDAKATTIGLRLEIAGWWKL
jgi:hypothetical protein